MRNIRETGKRTVFTLTSSEQREDGRLTKQFLRLWTRDISAGVAWLLRLLESGAIVRNKAEKEERECDVKLQQFPWISQSLTFVGSLRASAEQGPAIVADARCGLKTRRVA
jgi:hypothetical protein